MTATSHHFSTTVIPVGRGSSCAPMGAGDVKLATVLGAGLRFGNALAVLLLAYVLAALFRIASLVVEISPVALLKPFYHRIGSFFVPLWIPAPSPEEKEILAAPI